MAKQTNKAPRARLNALRPPDSATETPALLRWATREVNILACILDGVTPGDCGDEVRTAAVAAALDLDELLRALAQEPNALTIDSPDAENP